MRFADKVTFVKKVKSHYDFDEGEEVDDGEVDTDRMAKVTTPVKENRDEIMGSQKTDQIIIHLKNRYKDSYDFLKWKDHSYFFVNQTVVGNRQIIYMRGDSNGSQA